MKLKILISLSIVFCLGLNAQTTTQIIDDTVFTPRGLHNVNTVYIDGLLVQVEEPEVIPIPYAGCTLPPSQAALKPIPNQYGQYLNNDAENTISIITVKGQVVDAETAELVPLANVILKQNGEMVRGVYTDFEGGFELTAPDFGTYTIEVSFFGYKTKSKKLSLTQNVDDLVFLLEESAQQVIACGITVECYAPFTIAQQIEEQSIDESLFEDENESTGKLVFGNIKHNISIHKLPYVFLVIKETGQRTRVDYNGMYRFEDVAQGEYTLQVFLEGQLLKETRLSVSEQEKTQLSFSL